MPRLLLTLALAALLLAGCDRAPDYTIPADSVALTHCPIEGLSVPPGCIVEDHNLSSGWGARVQAGSDWDRLRLHLDAVLQDQGYRRVHTASIKDARSVRYEKPGSGKFFLVVCKPQNPGFNCILSVLDH